MKVVARLLWSTKKDCGKAYELVFGGRMFQHVLALLWPVCVPSSLQPTPPSSPSVIPFPGGPFLSPSPSAAPAVCRRTCWEKPPGPGYAGNVRCSWHRDAPSGSCVWHSCCWWTSGKLPRKHGQFHVHISIIHCCFAFDAHLNSHRITTNATVYSHSYCATQWRTLGVWWTWQQETGGDCSSFGDWQETRALNTKRHTSDT